MATFFGGSVASGGGGGGGGSLSPAIAAIGDKTILVMAKDSATISETAPESPAEGDLWFDSATATLYIYYGTAWVGVN